MENKKLYEVSFSQIKTTKYHDYGTSKNKFVSAPDIKTALKGVYEWSEKTELHIEIVAIKLVTDCAVLETEGVASIF